MSKSRNHGKKTTGAAKSKKDNLKKAGEITNIVVTVLGFLIGAALLAFLVWAAVKICMGLLPGIF